jgi:hypothetical protein
MPPAELRSHSLIPLQGRFHAPLRGCPFELSPMPTITWVYILEFSGGFQDTRVRLCQFQTGTEVARSDSKWRAIQLGALTGVDCNFTLLAALTLTSGRNAFEIKELPAIHNGIDREVDGELLLPYLHESHGRVLPNWAVGI